MMISKTIRLFYSRFRFILFVTLLIHSLGALGLNSYTRNPLIMNISSNEYGGARKNWDIDISPDGILYAANNKGLLEYNGIGWKLYKDAPCSVLRSVAIASDGTVYTGGFREFGFWRKDKKGILQYTSLSDSLIPADKLPDLDFTRIYVTPAGVYFYSVNRVFLWDYNQIIPVLDAESPIFFQQTGDKLWVEKEGILYHIENARLNEIARLPFDNLRIITPFDQNRFLIGNDKDGLFLLDNDKITPWVSDISDKLRSETLSCALQLENGNFLFGTMMNGVYVTNPSGNILRNYSTRNALDGNSVYAISQDMNGSIWLALDEGLCKMEFIMGSSFFMDYNKVIGSLSTSVIFNDKLYIGSSKGLFYIPLEALNTKFPFEKMQFVPESQGQVRKLQVVDDMLLCAFENGLMRITPQDTRLLYTQSSVFDFTSLSPRYPDHLLLATGEKPVVLKKEKGDFTFSHFVDGVSGRYNSLSIDQEGYLWLGHMYEGVTQAVLSDDRSRLNPVKDFFSDSHRTIISRIGHRTVFISNDRFFFYNDIDASVQPFDELNDLMMPVKNISQVIPLDPTHYWIIGTDISILISYDKGKAELIKAVGFDHKYIATGDDSQTIVPLDDATIMICMNNGFILSDKFRNQPVTHHKQLFIDKVEAKLKSGEIISIPLEGNSLPKLPANLKSIRISVGYPFSTGVDRFYQYKLSGIDKDWYQPSVQSSIRYERLPHGKYKLEIRPLTRNTAYENEVITFSFEILPPWYLSSWAWALWVSLILLIMGALYALIRYRHRLAMKKQDKINEEIQIRKTNEQLRLKVQSANHELFGITAAMAQNNEAIASLKNEIQDFSTRHPNLPVSKKLDKIIRSVDKKKSDIDDWSLFIMHFEQTHPAFFRNLKNRYPNLTPAELKLSACLKLNMASKEIASLLNISIRGVEAARYRLRKKISLEQNIGLNEFFIDNF